MIEKTCCFTGHRIIPDKQYTYMSEKLMLTIEKLAAEDGYLYFCTGGALGFDTLAALSVLKLRREQKDVELHLILPCENQAAAWEENDKIVYEKIKRQADKITYASFAYTPQCMYLRNRLLVNASCLCVCYLTEKKGGTYYTVRYAEKHGLRVINLADMK